MKPGTAISPAPIWTPLETANKQAESPVPPWTPAETPFITQQEQSGPLTRLSHALPKHEAAHIQAIRERCRQLYLCVFFEEQLSVRSLGFTSALSGDGKTFLAVVTAEVLANDTSNPVTLVECNWEHPCFHNYFKLPSTPGLAEWLRGECAESAIRHQITRNLTVIPAGNGRRSAVKLLRHALQKSVRSGLVHSDELLIVDLPPIVSTAYGSLAASMVESLVVVVRAQVTSEALVIEACEQLKHVPIHGIVLNQINSRIPRWLQQIL